VSEPRRNVVTVQIAGDEYSIRTGASEEYTRECAAFVDQMVRDVLTGGAAHQPHKASVLAALAITDQLFQARRESDRLREETVRRTARLVADIEARLSEPSLAPRP
jgi:cell division protein ZapA (FtsZ GTPase activity inhibitor)